MKFSLYAIIFAFSLIAGCSPKPLLKSSDPSLAPRIKTPLPAPANEPAKIQEVKAAAAPITPALPSTDPGYIVNCNGADRSLASCYEQADEICEQDKRFVSNILKIEDFKSGGVLMRSLAFRCNTPIDYGRVGVPDNGRQPITGKKPPLSQRLLLGN